MRPFRAAIVGAAALLIGFAGGMVAGFQLAAPPKPSMSEAPAPGSVHSARFIPLPPAPRELAAGTTDALPAVDVIDVERVRSLAGRQARVRGKVYRVGHSARSNTHFLDFGPSHSSFTAVIFASAAEAFKRENIEPRLYEGKELEIVGTIEDDPRYGLEMIIENPSQIREVE